MKVITVQIFQCPNCSRRLYFENLRCRCGQDVTFDPERHEMRLDGDFCSNREAIGCNWSADGTGLCRSCAMTRTVPDIGAPQNVGLWARTESAKRWMLDNLSRWGWFTDDDKGKRPVFRLLSEQTQTGEARVTMGHASGVITINVSEASEATIRARQENLGELYRTMLGHMRHEMAHFLFLRLAEQDAEFTVTFRELFGDEREDYGAALKRHYASPKPAGDDFVTAYATAHPHEDWAESTAHLLHLTDLLDSAASAGLSLPGSLPEGNDAYSEPDTSKLLSKAIDMAIALNHANRAMNLPDPYPFVLGSGVRRKLAVVHDALRRGAEDVTESTMRS